MKNVFIKAINQGLINSNNFEPICNVDCFNQLLVVLGLIDKSTTASEILSYAVYDKEFAIELMYVSLNRSHVDIKNDCVNYIFADGSNVLFDENNYSFIIEGES